MRRKPIILILTSRDEIGREAELIKSAVLAHGTHNVVVLTDAQYGKRAKTSKIDRLLDSGGDYINILEKRDRSLLREKLKAQPHSIVARRVANAVLRYNPEYILAITPYAHHCAVVAKQKAQFTAPILYYVNTFAADSRAYDDSTDVFIVDNQGVKTDLVKSGVAPGRIITLGLPFTAERKSFLEIASRKQELGLPKTRTVFLFEKNAKIRDELFELLSDQGDIINLIVYAEEGKHTAEMRARAADSGITAVFFSKTDDVDEFMSVSDMAVTCFDVSVIYKCFKLGIPAVVKTEGKRHAKDVRYLAENSLALKITDSIDVVRCVYALLQTDEYTRIVKAGDKYSEHSSVDSIAEYLVGYVSA